MATTAAGRAGDVGSLLGCGKTFLTFGGVETYLLFQLDTYHLSVVGGCCGTDADHLRAIAERCSSRPRNTAVPFHP